MDKDKFHEDLFLFQPHEVIPIVFDYFGAALKTAPPEKVEQFFVHFREGVMGAIESRRSESNAN